jgi:type I restriction enzyme R subunit
MLLLGDISRHFRDNWQWTPFKAQLVCQNKETAIKYKDVLDEIWIVTSDVVISSPDDREWEDDAFSKSSDRVKRFWDKMMDEHGTPKKYEENIISRYKNGKDPEIIIVVDKLLTGFDVPRNTVLYLTRSLKAHTLLQAIARVNRLYPDKDFGYIIDYYGILWELDSALEVYSSFDGFDPEDLKWTLENIDSEIATIKQKHSEIWDIFKEIPNKRDLEAFERLLKDQERRDYFYSKLSAFARTLKIALSSLKFHKETDPKLVDRYKDDLNTFVKLRQSVAARYSDEVDYSKYEWQIQKLIDTHIMSEDVKPITELVNIFDKSKFQAEIEKTMWEAAKADTIASRTAKHIEVKMDEDPAFYKKFSQMLKDAIKEYEEQRISETEYLNRVKDIMEKVLDHTDSGIPKELENNDLWRAIYWVLKEELENKSISSESIQSKLLDITLRFDAIIKESIVVDWYNKSDIIGRMKIELSDIIFDEIKIGMKWDFSFEEIDSLTEQIIWIAKIHCR